jgi:molybdopterin-guanine dinucleotide biosynthesis protein B
LRCPDLEEFLAIPNGMIYDYSMIPIVSIVGKSNSGKTSLIEKLVAELAHRGWRVATIKHNRHGFEVDHEGKDSWRHKKAGAVTTVVASPGRIAVISDIEGDYELARIRDGYIRNADIILAEGYKKNPHPKIEVFRTDLERGRLCGPDDQLVAIAGDRPVSAEVPWFDWNDASGLADWIVQRFLPRKTPSGADLQERDGVHSGETT